MVAVQSIKETNPIKYKLITEHIKRKYPHIYGSK